MRWTRYLLYPLLLPTDIIGVLWILILRTGGGELVWNDGCLVVRMAVGNWFLKLYKYGATTIGHTMLVVPCGEPEFDAYMDHEHRHTIQYETHAIAGAVMAASCAYWAPWAALAIWALSPWLCYIAGSLVALAYGKDWYLDNPDEVAAFDRVIVDQQKQAKN